jgi:putative addiction module component (TIGR02574 family)
MDTATDRLYEQARALPPEERHALAVVLVDSLGIDRLEDYPSPDSPEEIEAAWAAEIRRRIADLESGKTEPIPWEEVQKIFDEA